MLAGRPRVYSALRPRRRVTRPEASHIGPNLVQPCVVGLKPRCCTERLQSRNGRGGRVPSTLRLAPHRRSFKLWRIRVGCRARKGYPYGPHTSHSRFRIRISGLISLETEPSGRGRYIEIPATEYRVFDLKGTSSGSANLYNIGTKS